MYTWVWIQASAPETSLTSSNRTWEGDMGLGIRAFLGAGGGSRGGSLNALVLETAREVVAWRRRREASSRGGLGGMTGLDS